MKILHTSDWHVGKTMRGHSRADEHKAVLGEIAEVARAREVDVVLVGGDVFDTASPSPTSEQIVYQAFLDLASGGAEVVVIAGNHDNPRRLGAVKPLLDLTRVHACPSVARPDDGGVLEISTASRETARIALLPFLSQRGIVRALDLMNQDAHEHATAYTQRAHEIIAVLCGSLCTDSVNILLAHLMVHGGQLGGGERLPHTGLDYGVPTTVFPSSLHYVALGHLHRAQKMAGGAPIWYCGSPLQLDFGETLDEKSVNLVSAEPGKPVAVERVALSSGRRLRTVTGTLEQLEALADSVAEDYLRVDLDEQPTTGLADRVRELLPNAVVVRIVGASAAGTTGERTPRIGRSAQDLFGEYLSHKQAEDDRVRALFDELLDETVANDRGESDATFERELHAAPAT